jgi:hypothetical protein
MNERYVFTIATGRCGQATLTELVRRFVPAAFPAFEEPHAHVRLPGRLGVWERRFRRRFIETDTLLGRGRVFEAYVRGDDAFIEQVAARRIAMARRWLAESGKSVYFDISKFFARGLHIGFMRLVPRFGLVLLVRDPIENMRSYLNREKNFHKDNPPTDAPRNALRLDPNGLDKGELYLWAWCEAYLRFCEVCESKQVAHSVVLRTTDLSRPDVVTEAFRTLDLDPIPVTPMPPRNTNAEAGRGVTRPSAEDIRLFERFVSRLPPAILDRIDYLKDYRPRAVA